jgi:hypothetical protein
MFAVKPRFNISLALALFLISSAQFALAASPFSYAVPTADHAGRFEGQMPIDRIGNLLLPKGQITFAGDDITIKAVPQWLFDRSTVLKGAVLRAEGVQQAGGFVVGGLLLILDGVWLPNISKGSATEIVDTMDGASLRGRILGRDGEAFKFQYDDGHSENVAFSRIKSISSPRAFTFNISANAVKINPADSSMSFEATQLVLKSRQNMHSLWATASVPKSNLRGTEPGIPKAALATYVGLDLFSELAAPIAIPLVLNARNTRAAKNRIAEAEFQNFSNAIQPSGSSSGSSAAATGSTGSTGSAGGM